MLKSWSIKNFKPIVDSGELQFAPVTVLAGRNSSGKSSLLQSILMIAQTLSNRLPDRPLITNGLLTQLGTFEDVLNTNTGEKMLHVSFDLLFNEDVQEEQCSDQDEFGPFMDDYVRVKEVIISIEFISNKNPNSAASAIEASKIAIHSIKMAIDGLSTYFDDDSGQQITADIKREFPIKRIPSQVFENFIQNISVDYRHLLPGFKQQSNYYVGSSKASHNEETVLIRLSHFLPTRAIEKFSLAEQEKFLFIRQIRCLFDPVEEFLLEDTIQSFDKNTCIPNDLKQSIIDMCRNQGIEEFTGESFTHLQDWYKRNIPKNSNKSLGKEIRDLITNYFVNHPLPFESSYLEKSEGLRDFTLVSGGFIKEATEKTSKFFASHIRYLGPLRADPQASQKFSPSSELDDVGTKGEYAAAVYDANQQAKIEWFNPLNQQVEPGALEDALNVWVHYLGIADHVQIEVAGQSGYSWQIAQRKGQKALPLSSVGVGVSQILPILVMGLLSPANCLLIIEQPELHLHPYVQARLGDFFMGLAKCKKQCLIETHSENLVSQLRLHIVQAGGLEKSDCMVYFVDQDEKGAAKFEKIEISPNGNILNWPEGFFDETMLQEDRITAASLRKRAQKAKHDG